MKNKTKAIIVFAGAAFLMLFLTVDINAQRYGRRGGPGGPGTGFGPDSVKVERMIDRMTEMLSLDDSQAAKIKEIHYAHIAEAQKHREKMRELAEKNREEMEKSRKEMDEAVLSVLTDEQKEEFKDFRPGRGRGYYGPGNPPDDNRPGRGKGKRGPYCPYR